MKQPEDVQKGALTMTNDSYNLNYKQRWNKTRSISLAQRRIRGDLTYILKMTKNIEFCSIEFKLTSFN